MKFNWTPIDQHPDDISGCVRRALKAWGYEFDVPNTVDMADMPRLAESLGWEILTPFWTQAEYLMFVVYERTDGKHCIVTNDVEDLLLQYGRECVVFLAKKR